MGETLLTISLDDDKGSIPVLVVNWDEAEDGDVSHFLRSDLFAMASGVALPPGTDPASAFSHEHSSPADREQWEATRAEAIAEEGSAPALILSSLLPEVN